MFKVGGVVVVQLVKYDQGIVLYGIDVCIELMQQYFVVVGVVFVDIVFGYFECGYVIGGYVCVYFFVVIVVVVVLEDVYVGVLQDIQQIFFGCGVYVVVLVVCYLGKYVGYGNGGGGVVG